jgi:hypothetical protein
MFLSSILTVVSPHSQCTAERECGWGRRRNPLDVHFFIMFRLSTFSLIVTHDVTTSRRFHGIKHIHGDATARLRPITSWTLGAG